MKMAGCVIISRLKNIVLAPFFDYAIYYNIFVFLYLFQTFNHVFKYRVDVFLYNHGSILGLWMFQFWVDEERKLVYFMGTKDTPLELHLWV